MPTAHTEGLGRIRGWPSETSRRYASLRPLRRRPSAFAVGMLRDVSVEKKTRRRRHSDSVRRGRLGSSERTGGRARQSMNVSSHPKRNINERQQTSKNIDVATLSLFVGTNCKYQQISTKIYKYRRHWGKTRAFRLISINIYTSVRILHLSIKISNIN